MSSENKKNKKGGKKKKWPKIFAIFLLVILVFAGLIFAYQGVFAQKFFPGVKIANLELGGWGKKEVLTQLKLIEEDLQKNGIRFIYKDKEIMVTPIVISASDPDLTKPILTFDWQDSVEKAFTVGRVGPWHQRLAQQFKALILGQQILVNYDLNRDELFVILQTNFSALEKPPLEAQLKIQGDNIEVTQEESGYVFNYNQAVGQLIANIENLSFEPIVIDLVFTSPKIKKQYTGSALNSLENILKIDAITLKVDSKSWQLSKEQFTPWLEFQLLKREVVVGLNQAKIYEFLGPIAAAVNIEAKDAKFKLDGKRVVEFQASQDGKELNLEASYQKINQQIIIGDSSDVDLVVEVSPAKVSTGDINDLGIKESIGRGVSNFAGSPVNRRHNIAVGARTLNGILIEPGEEFSLLKALGEINAEVGYKPELVIKGDRTIPEYGGGLCQIGTTTFRAALYSGLPITQRRSHSYRVVYYEPAGMDATIYNPSPDMKFINDTGHYILFTTRIEGNELIFEFYGTKDGRKVEISPNPPSIFNITSSGQPRYIETDELAPGEKKKIESAHKGADTYFKYTVTYPDSEVKETDFNSHYVAWPEVWLVGRLPTTTEEVINQEN